MNTSNHQFGFVPERTARSGPWSIAPFEVSPSDASLHNLRCMINRRSWEVISPGRYMALSHDRRGVVMSNTPMEVRTNRAAYRRATGRVLINGLGLGMLVHALLARSDIKLLRVVEIDQDVINLHSNLQDPRLQVVHANAMEYRPARGEKFDFAWHDIWDDICASNLPQMRQLHRRYARRVSDQGSWSRDLVA